MQFALFAISLVVSIAVSFLMRPETHNPSPATLADFNMPQSVEGTPQQVIFGDVWIRDPFILWYGNLRTSDIRASGGKK